jgi:sigma-E factor negative regulatory protein RseA
MCEILEFKMTEQISALADDEIDLEDAEHLLAALQTNSHAAEVWAQYHLIGDVMRGAGALSPNFKQNLMQKIELEPTVLSPNAGLKHQLNKHAQLVRNKSKIPAAWSIAASFVAVMMVGWITLQTQMANHVAPAMVAQVNPTQVASTQVVSSHVTPSSVATLEEQKLPSEYLMAHEATAPTTSSYYIQTASYSE